MLDPRGAELANNHVNKFRTTNDKYGTWGPWNFGSRARKTAENFENYRNHRNWDFEDYQDGVQFRPLNREDDDESAGVQSPPLWMAASPPRTPEHHINNYRNLSPTSRTQAIAKGQRELMEMVKNMPESCYELSLKDLVEQPNRVETQEECLLQEKNVVDDQQVVVTVAHQRANSIKRQESKKNEKKPNMNMIRSGSMENRGLFLKMGFPISLSSNKKRHVNRSSTTSTCAKVSPKPEIPDRASKSVDKDWWKKRFSGSSVSDSSGRSSSTTNNNGSTGSSGSRSSSNGSSRSTYSIRKKSGFFSSCLPCFHFTKGKSTK